MSTGSRAVWILCTIAVAVGGVRAAQLTESRRPPVGSKIDGTPSNEDSPVRRSRLGGLRRSFVTSTDD